MNVHVLTEMFVDGGPDVYVYTTRERALEDLGCRDGAQTDEFEKEWGPFSSLVDRGEKFLDLYADWFELNEYEVIQ